MHSVKTDNFWYERWGVRLYLPSLFLSFLLSIRFWFFGEIRENSWLNNRKIYFCKNLSVKLLKRHLEMVFSPSHRVSSTILNGSDVWLRHTLQAGTTENIENSGQEGCRGMVNPRMHCRQVLWMLIEAVAMGEGLGCWNLVYTPDHQSILPTY